MTHKANRYLEGLSGVISGCVLMLDMVNYFHALQIIPEVSSPLDGVSQGPALFANLINLPTLLRQLSSEDLQLLLPLFALLPSNHLL